MALLIHSTCYCCVWPIYDNMMCNNSWISQAWASSVDTKVAHLSDVHLKGLLVPLRFHGRVTGLPHLYTTVLSHLWSIPTLQTHYGVCTSKSLLPPQGILCIKSMLCCFVALLLCCITVRLSSSSVYVCHKATDYCSSSGPTDTPVHACILYQVYILLYTVRFACLC